MNSLKVKQPFLFHSWSIRSNVLCDNVIKNMPFKMNFILLTFTGTSLTLILQPLHMSTLYRCSRTKKNLQVPLVCPELGSSQRRASAVQQRNEFDTGGFPVGTPGTVETTAETDGARQSPACLTKPSMLMQMWNLQISTSFKYQNKIKC